MKTTTCFHRLHGGLPALVACLVPLTIAAADHRAWQWQQSVEVKEAGMARIELPPPTLDAAQSTLADLRLLAPDGVETPWLLEHAGPPAAGDRAATGFKAVLEGTRTVLTARHDAGEFIAVTLESPAPAFLKSVTIEGSNDGSQWQTLAASEVVFRQAGGVERVRVACAKSDWQQLRVALDDERSAPVAFTGLRVSPAAVEPATLRWPLPVVGREERAGESRLTLDLGARNLHLAELQLEVADEVFSRPCQVTTVLTGPDGSERWHPVASGTLYRVLGENGVVVAGLAIPVHQRVAANRLVLIIRNGDSPPLRVREASATRYPDRLMFPAAQAGTWTLLTGNRHADAPRYDLAPLRGSLSRSQGALLNPGTLTARPGYQAPPALPEVTPAGSAIDLIAWQCRRAVQVKLPATVKIELDATTLAGVSRSDLGDLRLIQGGRQIPWLLASSPPLRSLSPQVTDDPDPKRPTVSRWQLRLPVAGLPVHSLTAIAPDPLFARHLRVLARGKDELGNPWTRVVGSATWTKTPGQAPAAQRLRMSLDNNRVPDTLWLETDNGDNPPIRLQDVTLHYEAPALVAKITEPQPVFLYYGNPRAEPPVYDLALVRGALLAADQQPAALGEPETLKPGAGAAEREISAGSPWLWAALAVVVIGLLFIVARLLPPSATPPADA